MSPDKTPSIPSIRDAIINSFTQSLEVVTLAETEGKSNHLSNLSDDGILCRKCKEVYASQGRYQAHMLRCMTKYPDVDNTPEPLQLPSPPKNQQKKKKKKTPTEPQQPQKTPAEPKPPNKKPAEPQPVKKKSPKKQLPKEELPVNKGTVQTPANMPPATFAIPSTAKLKAFFCDFQGCGKGFGSAPALKCHKTDAHGVGGQRLNFQGKDSWMLNQRARELLKAQGLLQAEKPKYSRSAAQNKPPPQIGHVPFMGPPGVIATSHRGRNFSPSSFKPQQAFPVRPPNGPQTSQAPKGQQFQANPPQKPVANGSVQAPTALSHGGAAEMEQARNVRDKTLRLLIQNDISIHNHGKVTVGGIDWIRVGVERQSEIVGMFEKMCHLPKALQGEFLPSPKFSQGEPKMPYLVTEFKPSPSREDSAPGLGLIALACTRVVLANGCEEVVKIAAVDLSTCRILMCHFVCTDALAEVADWRTKDTGLCSWDDMEQARSSGYKVLKGWQAARSSLWKFVDKETIIVGHNLRADLDTLRMIHGRAVDIAKVTEKAAKGPLSKVQLGLDSLCRTFPFVKLKIDPKHGRDPLMDAFGAREMCLWVLKNTDKFEKGVQQKSKEYQALMPMITITS